MFQIVSVREEMKGIETTEETERGVKKAAEMARNVRSRRRTRSDRSLDWLHLNDECWFWSRMVSGLSSSRCIYEIFCELLFVPKGFLFILVSCGSVDTDVFASQLWRLCVVSGRPINL